MPIDDLKHEKMKRLMALLLWLLATMSVSAQDIEAFVHRQMVNYPKSRLLDIYKSCFQDFMGAEHLVADKESVKAYLDNELSTVLTDSLMPWYDEPCGVYGRYVRVSLRGVIEGLISPEMLLDVFVRSANTFSRPSVDEWKSQWQEIIRVIDQMGIVLPNMEEDRRFIDGILAAGKYAISHSPDYREAYHPHYRIVERHIFDKEIKPLLK